LSSFVERYLIYENEATRSLPVQFNSEKSTLMVCAYTSDRIHRACGRRHCIGDTIFPAKHVPTLKIGA